MPSGVISALKRLSRRLKLWEAMDEVEFRSGSSLGFYRSKNELSHDRGQREQHFKNPGAQCTKD